MTAKVDKTATWKMFDKIAPRYDAINRILSFGIDTKWRTKVADYFPKKSDIRLLDLGTGTGDFILTLLNALGRDRFQTVIGIDLAEEMLHRGRRKMNRKKVDDLVVLKHGDATQIPFLDNGFDVVTIAFAIRNVDKLSKSLQDMYRVLDKNGRVFILEFSIPNNILLKYLYLFYFRYILPFVGGLISGNFKAYSYLNKSVEQFPYGESFCTLMRAVGYENVEAIPLSGGIATLYYGDKPE